MIGPTFGVIENWITEKVTGVYKALNIISNTLHFFRDSQRITAKGN